MKRLMLGTLCAAAGAAAAQPTFLINQGTSFWTYSNGILTETTLSDSLQSLAFTADGRLIGTSGSFDSSIEAYEVSNYLSGATLVQTGTVERRVATLTNINGDIYGIRQNGTMPTSDLLVRFDVDNGWSETIVGSLEVENGIGGSGYDAATDTFYVTSSLDDTAGGALYTVDYTNGSVISTLALASPNFQFQGGEWFNGEYYAALVDLDQDALIVGRFDVATGAFTQDFVVDTGVGITNGTVSLAIIPSPSSLLVVSMAGLFSARRRR